MGIRKGAFDVVPGLPGEAVERFIRQFVARHAEFAALHEETDFPAIDVYETGDRIVIEAELPGVPPESFEVSIASGNVVIEGLKDENSQKNRMNFLCMERTFGSFRRIVPLFQAIKPDRIRATYRAGILRIDIPKTQEKRGRRRRIPVTTD